MVFTFAGIHVKGPPLLGYGLASERPAGGECVRTCRLDEYHSYTTVVGRDCIPRDEEMLAKRSLLNARAQC